MKSAYITAPLHQGTITPIKCKAKRIKPAKRNQVPPDYRKDRIKRFKSWLTDVKYDIRMLLRKGI